MNYSLSHHDNGYSVSYCEALYFPFYSPYVSRHLELAKSRPNVSLGHKIVAIIESIPILGAIASLIERIVLSIYNRWFAPVPPVPRHSHCLSFHARELDHATAEKKMQKNALKALQEHRLKDPHNVVITDAEVGIKEAENVKLSFINETKHKGKGPPPHYEDAHVMITLPNGAKLMGVFDGHGGSEVSHFAAEKFPIKFSEAMKLTQDNVFRSFEITMHALHVEAIKIEENLKKEAIKIEEALKKEAIKIEEALKNAALIKSKHPGSIACVSYPSFEFTLPAFHQEARIIEETPKKEALKNEEALRKEALKDEEALKKEALKIEKALKEVAHIKSMHPGTTACVCYIDPKKHQIYTATLGDSEAKIYRKVNYAFKSIPLSCVRDWTSKKDMAHVIPAIEQYSTDHCKDAHTVVDIWKAQTVKSRRFPPIPPSDWGLNVSRALGDSACQGYNRKPAVIHKPKITVNHIQPGDHIVIASDGVWDYVPEDEMVKLMDWCSKSKDANIAFAVRNYALANRESLDNVTVLSITVAPA
jgi:serine/threonine protein phosphatase PrpC